MNNRQSTHDREQLVRALIWLRPQLVAGLLVSFAFALLFTLLGFIYGDAILWLVLFFVAVAMWYFVRLVRLQRKLEELGE